MNLKETVRPTCFSRPLRSSEMVRGAMCAVLAVTFFGGIWFIAVPAHAQASQSVAPDQSCTFMVPKPKAAYKYLQLQAQPNLPFSVGSSTANSLLKPGIQGISASYYVGVEAPAANLSLCHEDVLGMFFSRQYGNNTGSSVGREILGSFNIANVNLITDSFYLYDQVRPVWKDKDGNAAPATFVIKAGSQFAHAPCCNVINSQFNPDSVYHAAYFSIDNYFGPVIWTGTANGGGYQRVFDITTQYSEGSHVANDAYLQSQATTGQADSGAQGLLSLKPELTFPVGKTGVTYAIVNYARTAQRYDNTPQPLYTHTYTLAVDHALTDWLTAEVYGSVVAGQGYTQGLALPSNTNNSSVNFDLQFTQPW